MTPKRIQRKRTKGWKMPDGAVYVGRPTKWGNPFHWQDEDHTLGRIERKRLAVQAFDLNMDPFTMRAIREGLRGKDLVCWCRLDEPCHADVLLKIANDE